MQTIQKDDVQNGVKKCKVLDCIYPKRVGKKTGGSKKSKRRKHAFCSHHVWLKAQMSKKDYDVLKQSNNMWVPLPN